MPEERMARTHSGAHEVERGDVAPLERAVRWFDERQQEHWWLAFPVGVVRKYADDRGSAFAALVTFHVFIGLLPLLVVVLTVFGQLLEEHADITFDESA